jgi:hypothetical protein
MSVMPQTATILVLGDTSGGQLAANSAPWRLASLGKKLSDGGFAMVARDSECDGDDDEAIVLFVFDRML